MTEVSGSSSAPIVGTSSPVEDLNASLRDAEQLLAYTAEAGIDVPSDVAATIISAVRALDPWNNATSGTLFTAIAKLAAAANPVTAATLRACRNVALKKIRNYSLGASAILCLIIPLSFLSFVTSGLSKSITADVQTANELLVKLHANIDAAVAAQHATQGTFPSAVPASTLEDLQQFAATVRSIRQDALILNRGLWRIAIDIPPDVNGNFELPAGPVSANFVQQQTTGFTSGYQAVRRFAKDVQDEVALYYGAISSVLLPMLYALLGAFAYLLRLFTDELKKGTFSTSYAVFARLIVALIGGLIIGLFNNFSVSGGASLSPLALAFLVGYAADAFYAFLEGLLQTFKRTT